MPPRDEWTLMFFFASDDPLSALTVSQLKAIKDAGYEKHTNVLVYFDSNERGVPLRLFHVNSKRKLGKRKTSIGDGKDPFVRNMIDDEIDKETITSKRPASKAMAKALKARPDAMDARKALETFVGYCRENFPARHYQLFLIGHGMIVGNDTFLGDSNPVSAITLKELQEILYNFKEQTKDHGTFELLAMHSCCMSALEVAYQLKGTAKYMMSSEGLSIVGCWPYRHLLKKTFSDTHRFRTRKSAKKQNRAKGINLLLEDLYYLSLFNATDFALCGYSLDLTLCSLDPKKLSDFAGIFGKFTERLKRTLEADEAQSHLDKPNSGPTETDLIVAAHLKSQSYWEEDYTDIYDFCRCLSESCDLSDESQRSLSDACESVIKALEVDKQVDKFERLIVHSDNFGWRYQYSHGLSIYFPWSQPAGDSSRGLRNYSQYDLNIDLEDNSWLSFLRDYWRVTLRAPEHETPHCFKLLSGQGGTAFIGSLGDKPGASYGDKPGGGYGGGACFCPSIKNFPVTHDPSRRAKVFKQFNITEGIAPAFNQDGDR